MNPATRVRAAARRALKRRYGYAALRVVRRAVRQALRAHRERILNPFAPYSGSELEIRREYFAAMRRIRKQWPRLNVTDPRGEP